MAIMTGIEYRKIIFSDKYPPVVKNEAKYRYESAKDDIILFLNPISINWLENLNNVAIW